MNRKAFIFQGIFLQIMSALMAHYETKAYGGNLVPGTTCEALCDLIVVIVCLTGTVLFTIGMALPKVSKP